MTLKNNNTIKEKSSFWKKLGLGKSKTTSVPSFDKQQQVYYHNNDASSIKSKKKTSNSTATLPLHKKQSFHQQPMPMLNNEYITDKLLIKSCTTNDIRLNMKQEEEVNEKEINSVGESVTLSKSHDTKLPTSSDKSSASSFVVFEAKDELLETISKLKLDLENEKANVIVLKKQKEAMAKDLDYLGSTIDELSNERTDLIQQLEEEKIENQRHLDELNMLLEKMKSTADNARDQSFQMIQSKQAFESYQLQAEEEKNALQAHINEKDKTIRELKYQLKKAEDQAKTLNETIDKLIKSHAAEISRITYEKSYYTTPHGSPTLLNSELNENDEQEKHHSNDNTIASSQSSSMMTDDDLDDQLMKLTKEKERLLSFYSKIPLSGGGPQSRRRKEELEAMLDQVDSQLSKIKQKIRRS
ncbi:MAG: hypothetical protein EXX96DRAFT_616979 [Benjaminiella poitrasii]|nr:MAG: hypothetical protein EXX96DRAFT_616979 [Benjaminiella poitrasii]